MTYCEILEALKVNALCEFDYEVIDLIESQKAENERLSNCIMSEEQVTEVIRKTIDRDFGKRMLEDYQKLVDAFHENVKALNYDYYTKTVIMNVLRLALIDVQGQDVKSLKAETVKEFVERIKKSSCVAAIDQDGRTIPESVTYTIREIDLDKIASEIKEGQT